MCSGFFCERPNAIDRSNVFHRNKFTPHEKTMDDSYWSNPIPIGQA
jgi:hypothetical protein